MEKRNLYIAISLVLVVGLALSFYINFTGQSTLGTDKGDCIDTDSGFDVNVKGNVSYENRDYSYTDYCYSKGEGPEKYINEYYCDGDIQSDERNCVTEGKTECIEGACV